MNSRHINHICLSCYSFLCIFTDEVLSDDGPNYAPMPESLMLCANGQILINRSSYGHAANKEVVPPEYFLAGHSTLSNIERVS